MTTTLEILARETAEQFGSSSSPPVGEDFASTDGYDELEKRDARLTFEGKDAQSIFRLLEQEAFGPATNELEQLGVLAPTAIRYYFGPFLLRLLHVARSPEVDDEYVSNVLFRLLQLLRLHGPELFSNEQRGVLSKIIDYVLNSVESDTYWAWRSDIVDYGSQCLAMLLVNTVR